jgi:hypothetical protein
MRVMRYKISQVQIPRMPTTTTTTKFVVGVIIILGFWHGFVLADHGETGAVTW